MKIRPLRLTAGIMVCMLISSCGAQQQSSGEQSGPSYKDTKTMVLDILKSEDAAKTMMESSRKTKSQGLMLLATEEGMQIQQAVKEVLTGSDGSKLMEKIMTDPMFASDFAKAIQEQNKKLQKDLLKEPEYQKTMIQIMRDPEYTKIVDNVLKAPQFKLTMMTVIKESLQSPIFRAELVKLMGKAIEEETKPKNVTELKAPEEKGGKKKEGGGEEGGGGEGGGEEGGGEEGGGEGGGGSSS
ncbi:MAG: spore gernimation protein [Gorillibacterium sp.]|nr:spore gernimation protein [Gorillibacterium sp.]